MIKKTFLLGALLALTGCAAMDSMLYMDSRKLVTNEEMVKYATIDELFAKSPALRSGAYLTYYESYTTPKTSWRMDEIKLPVSTLHKYCNDKDGGEFNVIGGSIYSYAQSHDPSRQQGTYFCRKGGVTLWGAEVQVAEWNSSTEGAHKSARLKVKKIDGIVIDRRFAEDAQRHAEFERLNAISQKKAEEKRQAEQKLRQKQQADFAAEVASRKPVGSSHVGRTICRETFILGSTQHDWLRKLPNSRSLVAGVLEQMPANSSNIKVSLLGAKTTTGSTYAFRDISFDNISIERGKVIWENRKDWFLCD